MKVFHKEFNNQEGRSLGKYRPETTFHGLDLLQHLIISLVSVISVLFLSLSQHTLFTAIHKHYSVEDWKKFAADHPDCLEVTP